MNKRFTYKQLLDGDEMKGDINIIKYIKKLKELDGMLLECSKYAKDNNRQVATYKNSLKKEHSYFFKRLITSLDSHKKNEKTNNS